MILFSGDVFNPSLMSVVTKGKVKDTIQKYVLINELIFVAHGSSLE